MPNDDFLSLAGLTMAYGRTTVLEGIDLSIGKGEFVALLGSSGCGKTTLLRTIAGFATPTGGRISVGGRDVTGLGPEKRGMAMVFQSYALWPHMTVAQNIGYGLKLKGMARSEIAGRVAAMEDLLGLAGLGNRKPAALSGGQRQRVALGRALAIDPEILLLDEPLSNLDARIRLSVRHEIRALQRRLGITAVHVTHDREEAMVMADRIIILNRGRIEQQGAPEEVFNRPQSAFIAAFMGAENVVRLMATATTDALQLAPHPITAGFEGRPRPYPVRQGPVEVRFRGEAARLLAGHDPEREPATLDLNGSVIGVSYPGGVWRHVVALEGQGEVLVDAPRAFAPGDEVTVRIADADLFIFTAQDDHSHASSLSRPPAETLGRRETLAVEPVKPLETHS